MSDLINRTKLVTEITEWRGTMADVLGEEFSGVGILDRVIKKIQNQQSAQPEIIRCKDCVCGHGEVWLFGNGRATAYGYCGRTHLQVLPYDFCSRAERRN